MFSAFSGKKAALEHVFTNSPLQQGSKNRYWLYPQAFFAFAILLKAGDGSGGEYERLRLPRCRPTLFRYQEWSYRQGGQVGTEKRGDGVVGRAYNRFIRIVERRVQEHGSPGAISKGPQQLVKDWVVFPENRLHSAGSMMNNGRNLPRQRQLSRQQPGRRNCQCPTNRRPFFSR
jgi:hypothetical protein